MDSRQNEAVNRYAKLLKSSDVDLAVAVGRHSEHLGIANEIWTDIVNKLKIKKDARLLDIGCGFGELTQFCLKHAASLNIELHLLDIEEAIDRVKQEMKAETPPSTAFWNGVFPEVTIADHFPKTFDSILVYSVLHYTDQPNEFVEKAVSLLAEGGKLLLGDLPNVHKKGRFLSSDQGREFEAEYRKVSIEEIPKYENQTEFFSKCTNQNKNINDDFISNIVNTYRSKGFHVYVLPQPEALPFCKTREDILIARP